MATKQQVAAATEKAALLGHLLWGFRDFSPLIRPERLPKLITMFDDEANELEELLEVPGVSGELSLGNTSGPVTVAGWPFESYSSGVLTIAKAVVRELRRELPVESTTGMLDTTPAFSSYAIERDILLQCQKEYERRYGEALPEPDHSELEADRDYLINAVQPFGDDENVALVVLDDEDQTVLRKLSDIAPRSIKLADLAADDQFSLDRKTIGKSLKKLEVANYVDRPNGLRSGFAITTTGIDVAKKMGR